MGARDLVIRTAVAGDAPAIARIYVDTWRVTYAPILPSAYLAKLDVEKQTKSWDKLLANTSERVIVAVLDGVVLGFASGGREREQDAFFRGEIYTLYVVPELQRQGIGASLLVEMLRRLVDHTPVLVWVLKDNRGARRFYEALGGLPVRTQRENVGGRDVEKVGFAYFDVG